MLSELVSYHGRSSESLAELTFLRQCHGLMFSHTDLLPNANDLYNRHQRHSYKSVEEIAHGLSNVLGSSLVRKGSTKREPELLIWLRTLCSRDLERALCVFWTATSDLNVYTKSTTSSTAGTKQTG